MSKHQKGRKHRRVNRTPRPVGRAGVRRPAADRIPATGGTPTGAGTETSAITNTDTHTNAHAHAHTVTSTTAGATAGTHTVTDGADTGRPVGAGTAAEVLPDMTTGAGAAEPETVPASAAEVPASDGARTMPAPRDGAADETAGADDGGDTATAVATTATTAAAGGPSATALEAACAAAFAPAREGGLGQQAERTWSALEAAVPGSGSGNDPATDATGVSVDDLCATVGFTARTVAKHLSGLADHGLALRLADGTWTAARPDATPTATTATGPALPHARSATPAPAPR
ncbi:hypothetical protein [Streptomyces sp. NPDC097619]|uniref:hypothetical protein n=1 Tax=Streptomyces sp. NPDC097619 TaxID=3157228 RepID=UPI00332CC261